MAIASLLDVDLKLVIRLIRELTGVDLPREAVEVSLVPGEGVLHIRFREPRRAELGEPIHPLIHIYRDAETDEVTAVEVVDLEKLLEIAKQRLSYS